MPAADGHAENATHSRAQTVTGEIENLTKQLAREKTANQPVQRQDFTSWKADNPWYGSDYAKTRFAMRYIRELQRERPDLVGRQFLDAVSAKVDDQFGSR